MFKNCFLLLLLNLTTPITTAEKPQSNNEINNEPNSLIDPDLLDYSKKNQPTIQDFVFNFDEISVTQDETIVASSSLDLNTNSTEKRGRGRPKNSQNPIQNSSLGKMKTSKGLAFKVPEPWFVGSKNNLRTTNNSQLNQPKNKLAKNNKRRLSREAQNLMKQNSFYADGYYNRIDTTTSAPKNIYL